METNNPIKIWRVVPESSIAEFLSGYTDIPKIAYLTRLGIARKLHLVEIDIYVVEI